MLQLAIHLQFLFLGFHADLFVYASLCKWDVSNCNQIEVSCGDKESVLLDAKRPLDEDHCIAIKDKDYGDYTNYEIDVDLLSLESAEGINSGYIGIIFNYLDQRNYDFINFE